MTGSLLPRLAFIVPVFLLISAANADPDLWGHVRFGDDIISARAIPDRDGYSFTSDRPWVNHEWLSEVLMAVAYRAGRAPGLIALHLGLVAAMLYLVTVSLRRAGVPPLARDGISCAIAIATYATTATMRPQLFSLVLTAWLLSRLVEADERGWRALAGVPVLMALWANVHGGWLVGIGILAIWTAAALVSHVTRPQRPSVAPRPLLAILGLSALATLLNPYGVGLVRFLAETVSPTRADIVEWGSLLGAPGLELGVWLVTCGAVGASVFVARRRGVALPHGAFVVIAVLAAGAFRVRRLDAFFVLTAAILAGRAFATRRASSAVQPPAAPASSQRFAPAAALAVLVVTGVVLDGTLRPAGRFGCIDASDPRLPDREAGEAFQRWGSDGRMLTWFDWGEYAIWHLAPGIRVSIDGRRETVYSDDVVQAHLVFYQGLDGGMLANRLRPDYIWLPASVPAVGVLTAGGWQRVFETPRSVVFARADRNEGAWPSASGSPAPLRRACFP